MTLRSSPAASWNLLRYLSTTTSWEFCQPSINSINSLYLCLSLSLSLWFFGSSTSLISTLLQEKVCRLHQYASFSQFGVRFASGFASRPRQIAAMGLFWLAVREHHLLHDMAQCACPTSFAGDGSPLMATPAGPGYAGCWGWSPTQWAKIGTLCINHASTAAAVRHLGDGKWKMQHLKMPTPPPANCPRYQHHHSHSHQNRKKKNHLLTDFLMKS